MSANPIRDVQVITTGGGAAHAEHVYGTKKPTVWWVFMSRRWVRLPVNVYLVEHADGLVLFDTGANPAAASDRDYWPDPVTALFARRLFRWDIGPDDALGAQIDKVGYSPDQVTQAVMSHLHFDHAGGIADIPNADLYVSAEAWEQMLGPHPEREMVLRNHLEVLGARWRPIRFQPTTDPDLAPFGESFDVMGDGSITVVPTPGHLPGSVSMLVRRPQAAPVLMVGDLTYSEQMLLRDQVPATGDPTILRASFAKVRALRERLPGLIILPAHDPDAAKKLQSSTLQFAAH